MDVSPFPFIPFIATIGLHVDHHISLKLFLPLDISGLAKELCVSSKPFR